MAARLARQFGASTEGRLSWADAGGSTPSLGGVYPLNTAGVAVDLGTGTYPTYGSLSADPFDLAGGFILNLQFQYEAA